MTEPTPPTSYGAPPPGYQRDDVAPGRVRGRIARLERRRSKIAAELERNRNGDYRVPTWVLVAGLGAVIGAWVAIIVFG